MTLCWGTFVLLCRMRAKFRYCSLFVPALLGSGSSLQSRKLVLSVQCEYVMQVVHVMFVCLLSTTVSYWLQNVALIFAIVLAPMAPLRYIGMRCRIYLGITAALRLVALLRSQS